MGSLRSFDEYCKNLKQLIQQTNATVMVETGCFRGYSIDFGLSLGFDKIYSCDVDPEMINYCRDLFRDKPVELLQSTSVAFLDLIARKKLQDIDSVVFFLDAHLPGFNKSNGKEIQDTLLNFPLQEELAVINRYRSDKNDIIIINDLRLYEDGPYESGNWDERNKYKVDLSFLSSYNYIIKRFYRQEGYLLLTKMDV